VLVGTAELTRLQDPNCTLSSEIPEIFKRRVLLIRSVSFPFPEQQHLYTAHRSKSFVLLYFILLNFIFMFYKCCLLGKQEGWITITGIVTTNCRNCC